MVESKEQQKIEITVENKTIEQVGSYKYLETITQSEGNKDD